jgi:hypothetical protein
MFFLLTVFIPLVMLNLLIAVISDTHSTVTKELEKTDNFELNSVILDLENFL